MYSIKYNKFSSIKISVPQKWLTPPNTTFYTTAFDARNFWINFLWQQRLFLVQTLHSMQRFLTENFVRYPQAMWSIQYNKFSNSLLNFEFFWNGMSQSCCVMLIHKHENNFVWRVARTMLSYHVKFWIWKIKNELIGSLLDKYVENWIWVWSNHRD